MSTVTPPARYPAVTLSWSADNVFSAANEALWGAFFNGYLDLGASIPGSYLRALHPDTSTTTLVTKILDGIFLTAHGDPRLSTLLRQVPVPDSAYIKEITATLNRSNPNLSDIILMDEFQADHPACQHLQQFIDCLYHFEQRVRLRSWTQEDLIQVQDPRHAAFFNTLGAFLRTLGC